MGSRVACLQCQHRHQYKQELGKMAKRTRKQQMTTSLEPMSAWGRVSTYPRGEAVHEHGNPELGPLSWRQQRKGRLHPQPAPEGDQLVQLRREPKVCQPFRRNGQMKKERQGPVRRQTDAHNRHPPNRLRVGDLKHKIRRGCSPAKIR